MTDDRMALAEMLEKACDGDLVREMIALMAQRLMDADVPALVDATLWGPLLTVNRGA